MKGQDTICNNVIFLLLIFCFVSSGYHEDCHEVQSGSRSKNGRIRQLYREDIHHLRRRWPRLLNSIVKYKYFLHFYTSPFLVTSHRLPPKIKLFPLARLVRILIVSIMRYLLYWISQNRSVLPLAALRYC